MDVKILQHELVYYAIFKTISDLEKIVYTQLKSLATNFWFGILIRYKGVFQNEIGECIF